MATLAAVRIREHRGNKFIAAMKGIDLDQGSKEESMARVQAEMERLELEMGIDLSVEKKGKEYSDFGIAVVEGD